MMERGTAARGILQEMNNEGQMKTKDEDETFQMKVEEKGWDTKEEKRQMKDNEWRNKDEDEGHMKDVNMRRRRVNHNSM